MSEPLHHELVDLGLGLTAEVTITEIEPEPAPDTGTDWPAERDWPRAQLRIALPAIRVGSSPYACTKLHPALRCSVKVLGESCGECWGHGEGRVHKDLEWRRPRLAESTDYLRVIAAGDLAQLRAHVARRVARLEQRERTLAEGRAPVAAPEQDAERPLELDVSAPGPDDDTSQRYVADDDTSQRYALLELDSLAEQPQPAATTPRNRRRKAA